MTDLTGLDTLLALRDLLQNEEKYGPVLDEMRALRDETREQAEHAVELGKQIAADKAAAETARTETAAKHNEIHQSLLPREKQVQLDAKMLEEKQAVLDGAISNHRQEVITVGEALKRREDFVSGRERDQDAKEAALKSETVRVADLRKEYETKLGKLKSAVA